jgi:hypothetical protein
MKMRDKNIEKGERIILFHFYSELDTGGGGGGFYLDG